MARQGLKHPKGQSYCLGRQQLECNQEDQEAHLENSQSRLKEPLGAVERCSRSSYDDDDDGRMQGGKSTVTHRPEFQMANDFRFDHMTFDIYRCEFDELF